MVSEELKSGRLCTNQSAGRLFRADGLPAEWWIASDPLPYPRSLNAMKARARAIAEGTAGEAVWLLEHPPLYTAGTSAKADDLLDPDRFPVFEAGRGGQYTYHGPGQRVAYVMLDLRARGRDVRCFVNGLEQWIIDTLSEFNIKGERRADRVGVWVSRPERGLGAEDKIAAIGVRVSKWVSFHGIALNIAPDLDHFSGIVPCGISDHGVTSLEDLGHLISMPELDIVFRARFEKLFGPVVRAVGLPSELAGHTETRKTG